MPPEEENENGGEPFALTQQEAPAHGMEHLDVFVGEVERITFANEENGFAIARLHSQEKRETVTVKGTMGTIREGETLKVWGRWEDHPTYGPQFAAQSVLVMEPATLEGIQRYLEANIHGVGAVLAKRIVKIFGRETFKVIDETPEKLLEVPKFPPKVLDEIKEGWAETKVKREILVYLHSVGISPAYAEKIHATYGTMAVDVIKDNPYQLALDVRGIGFRIADRIAREVGIPHDSPRRVEAGVLFAMDEATLDGHTGQPAPELARRATALLEVPPELVQAAIATLINDGSLKPLLMGEAEEAGLDPVLDAVNPDDAITQEMLSGGVLLFRPRFFRAEELICKRLAALRETPAFANFRGVDEAIAGLEAESGLYLNDEQREAIELALREKVMILTGGPGTGKTTIIHFMLTLMATELPQVVLAAPTGKAAKRLSETTGREARTIHRLLEAGPRGFQRNADNPVEADLIIVDESSMIDTLLMEALLAALPDEARMLLVGDVDQLPSVGPGLVLGDLIQSGVVPVSRLETIHRQAQAGRITANAHAVRRGDMPDLSRPPDGEQLDFYFIEETEPSRIVEKMRMMLLERIPEAFGMDPARDVQVLTPMHKGLTGARNLNRELQAWLNPDGAAIPHGDPPFRVGDKVMQIRNDYDKQVFNGDMGEITAHDPEAKEVRVRFDAGEATYAAKELDNLTLGYATTVHKSQGSEYPAVLLPLTTHHAIMLQRNLFYTALTRGKRLVVVVGTRRAVGMAVHNDRPVIRHTGLRQRIAAWAAEE